MSITSSISIQMSDFAAQIHALEKNFDLIHKTTQDILSDLNDGNIINLVFLVVSLQILKWKLAKNSLNESVSTSNENQENIEEFTNKLFDSVFGECDSIYTSSKKLHQSIAEAKHFNTIEQEFRRNVIN